MVQDLCESCLYYSTCTRYPLFNVPIVYCDTYTHKDGRSGSRIMPELKGLCKNCRKRFVCTCHKPEAGVWHCEEYQ